MPVGVYSLLEPARFQNFACLIFREASLLGDPDKRVGEGDVQTVHEIGAKQSVVDGIATWLRLRPLGQLLGQSAVVRHRAIAVVQTLIGHLSDHAGFGCRNVDIPSGEELFKRETLLGRVGVQREMRVLDADLVGGTETFYTHGAEIAPRSDVVGEEFQDNWVRHVVICDLSDCPCAH